MLASLGTYPVCRRCLLLAHHSPPAPPPTHCCPLLQIGMGGGMKAGVNVWRAMRDIKNVHPAWRHVANKPVTEADLPRPITDPNCAGGAVAAGDVAAAIKASFGADMAGLRKGGAQQQEVEEVGGH